MKKFLSLIIVLFMLAGCGGSENAVYAQSVAKLNEADLGSRPRFAGVVVTGRTRELRRESGMAVKEFFVALGDEVREGDPLFSYDDEALRLRIPLGNLLGSDLLMGRGPAIPIDILMLTSSFVQLDNELTSTGINQSRHAITLRADVDIEILLPWESIQTTVESDVMIAETVIVGRVPQTYVNLTEEDHGRK